MARHPQAVRPAPTQKRPRTAQVAPPPPASPHPRRHAARLQPDAGLTLGVGGGRLGFCRPLPPVPPPRPRSQTRRCLISHTRGHVLKPRQLPSADPVTSPDRGSWCVLQNEGHMGRTRRARPSRRAREGRETRSRLRQGLRQGRLRELSGGRPTPAEGVPAGGWALPRGRKRPEPLHSCPADAAAPSASLPRAERPGNMALLTLLSVG